MPSISNGVSIGTRVPTFSDAVAWLRSLGIEVVEAVVERYPHFDRTLWQWAPSGDIFCYNFLNAAGRNVGTYIPCTDGVMTQPGTDGQGREYLLPMPYRMSIH